MSKEQRKKAGRIGASMLAKAAKLVKLFKFGKVALTFGSMILSVIVYAFFLGPLFAVFFVLMLFIHEMGHIVALRRCGHKVGGPVFIPMLGAVIFSPKFTSRWEEAFIGIAGPAVGGIAGLAVFAFWRWNPTSQMTLFVSYLAIYLNFFNLIPIRPLDGGRITQAVGGTFAYFGIFILLMMGFVIHSSTILLIWIIVALELNLSKAYRLRIGAVTWVAMIILMLAGYSGQPWAINLLDLFLGAFILFMHGATAPQSMEEYNSNPPLTQKARTAWLASYAFLALALGFPLYIEHQHLAAMIHK